MENTIYLIRHSTPFIPLNNYENMPWTDFNRNMMLSVEGEKRAEKMSKNKELNNISAIYCTDSARAIATAKYIAEKNNLKLNIVKELAERKLGIKYLKELPKGFESKQFEDENLKLEKGESVAEVKQRMEKAINKILTKNQNNKVAVVIHGVNLLTYLKLFANVSLSSEGVSKITYNNKLIYNSRFQGNDVFKFEYINKKLISIKYLK
jgi:broad specificity phosphatase PhoE